jgi:hypothetical protein
MSTRLPPCAGNREAGTGTRHHGCRLRVVVVSTTMSLLLEAVLALDAERMESMRESDRRDIAARAAAMREEIEA